MLYEAINSTFYGLDTAIYRFFGGLQSIPMNKFAWFMTWFGGDQCFYVLMALSVILCLFKKTRKYGMSILFGLGIAWTVTNLGIKLIIQRPRPFVTLRETPFWGFYEQCHQFAAQGTSHQPSYEPSFSFPSGHTTNSFSYTTAFILAGATSYKTGTNKHRKWQYWLIPLPFLVGMSRIYIFVHYPTDVIFGMVNGIFWGTIGFLVANALYNTIEEQREKRQAARAGGPPRRRKKKGPVIASNSDPTMVRVGANKSYDYRKYQEEKASYERDRF